MWGFLRQLNNSGTTIVLTTHYLEEAESLCKHIAIIDKGEIIEHSPMKQLLGKLNVETFILELENAINNIPASDQFRLRLIDPLCIEVELERGQNINTLFDFLSTNKILVRSMRGKSNRLEELFIRLLNNNGDQLSS